MPGAGTEMGGADGGTVLLRKLTGTENRGSGGGGTVMSGEGTDMGGSDGTKVCGSDAGASGYGVSTEVGGSEGGRVMPG